MSYSRPAPELPITSAQVQANFITYMRHFIGFPGIQFNADDATTWIASPQVPGSHILHASFPPAAVDIQIDQTLSEIGRYADRVDWLVFPSCRPTDLGARLAARGADSPPDGWRLYGEIGGRGGTWMIIDLAKLRQPHPLPAEFQIDQVADQDQLTTWLDVNARGFGSGDYSTFRFAYRRHGFGADAQAIHFIGYLDHTPVTSATLLLAGGCASVYNVSTPPDYRRQGFGSAITHAALQFAQARGYAHAWIMASQQGKSVYAGLGFTVTDFGMREYQWRKTAAAS